ncbi:MAG: TlpA family protein disulfide reductase [Desulfurococcales archaeon]|nr:TlpA family protein disulfide reductase [Desulfurococcales archaeon]
MAKDVRMLMAILSIILIIAIGYVVATGGDGRGTPESREPATTSIVAATSTYKDSGSKLKASDFKVKDINGNTVSLSDYRGRPVIIWFMAAWCPSCIYMSNIISQAIEGRDDVVVIMIDIWSKEFLQKAGILGKPGYPPPDTVDKLRYFKERYGKDDWIAVMDDGGLVSLYNVKYIDTVFVVDRDGSIVFGGGNVATVESLRAAISGG